MKKYLLSIALTFVLTASISVYATLTYKASDITFDNTVSGMNATTVQDAIEEIESDINKCINKIELGNAKATAGEDCSKGCENSYTFDVSTYDDYADFSESNFSLEITNGHVYSCGGTTYSASSGYSVNDKPNLTYDNKTGIVTVKVYGTGSSCLRVEPTYTLYLNKIDKC